MDAPQLTIKTRVLRAVIVLAMIGGSIGIFIALSLTRPLPGSTEQREERQRVAVFHPIRVDVPRQWIGYGTVRALNSADVPARVGATVVDIAADAKAGATVDVGQFLVQLDDVDFRRSVESAIQQIAAIDAQLAVLSVEEDGLFKRLVLAKEETELAKNDETRTRNALESGAASARELDRSRQQSILMERAQLILQEASNQLTPRRGALMAQREIQRTARTTAQSNLERCRISSPIGGVLQSLDLEIGESVSPGQVVARVVDVSQVEIPIRLPGSSRGSVRVGDRVDFEIVPQAKRIGSSTVARIEPEDDPLDRTMTVYVEVTQSADLHDRIAPGEFAEALVQARDSTARTVIPRRAVRAERVMELVDGKIVARAVTVSHAFRGSIAESGVDDVEWLVLEEPLPDGITIAVDGGRRFAQGTRVEAIEGDHPESRP
ncbi:MAG: HlyD family efflux transporter periplasmic adaptor subunit [Phycisphaerales bacterium]|nr:HlyD family efflux transporter periplasmic adaptor subunit [Phycisphaerales bacterium]